MKLNATGWIVLISLAGVAGLAIMKPDLLTSTINSLTGLATGGFKAAKG